MKDLAPGDDNDHQKDGKTYRSKGNCGTGNRQSLGHMAPISTMNLLCDPGCRMAFYSRSDMQMHTQSDTETKPHKCPHCSKTFANISSLALIHSEAKPPIVVTFVRNPSASSHICISTPESILVSDRPYKCAHPGCEKAFT